ncbi:CobW family GTP-binding protein [Flammeovirga kamogawensis]|uniref:GTP-binding protein n=1 Tax=Flammeovirga kamogawensis TaxID=373891 RepID=A0ABX8GYI8_9BACT|nr:GTP-binding protein [Flammeovirga kamogawensis]MBB6460816.1 G3E family GTPase [Flammeovirga kamogawensis]QWG08167.1 GTP-binding protein [Flammeovirga kamogawensis]TRX69970.1 GTP-binding protein [Flammeovirga kamogawensis]
MEKIKVTLITGFLGAGKTTFLNNLIKKYPESKFAVIENEFGEVGIDGSLVVDNQEDIFELSNGCICCSLNGELRDVLRNLLNSGKKFDHLLIETTGVADPSAVAAAFVGDPGIASLFELNATVGIVDVKNVIQSIKEDDIAVKQIAFSDFIVFSKCDEVDEDTIKQALFQCKLINPLALTEKNYNGEVVQKDILNLNAFSSNKVEERASFVAGAHSHNHGDTVSYSFTFEGNVDATKLEMWLSVLLQLQFEVIYRFKGIFNITGEANKVIVQGVRNESKIILGSEWDVEEERLNKIVIIGKGIKREAIEKKIKTILQR